MKMTDSVKFITMPCYGYQVVFHSFQVLNHKQTTQAVRKLMCFISSQPLTLLHRPNQTGSCSETSAAIIGSNLAKLVIKHFAGSTGWERGGADREDCSLLITMGESQRFLKARGGKLSNQTNLPVSYKVFISCD